MMVAKKKTQGEIAVEHIVKGCDILGWSVAVSKGKNLQGIVIGTDAYIKKILGTDTIKPKKAVKKK